MEIFAIMRSEHQFGSIFLKAAYLQSRKSQETLNYDSNGKKMRNCKREDLWVFKTPHD